MNAKSYCLLAAAIFAVVALIQLLRVLMGWSIALNGHAIPFWASWVAVVVAGGLSLLGFRAARNW